MSQPEETVGERKFRHYKAPEAIAIKLKLLQTDQDNWHGILAAVEDWLIILSFICCSHWVYQHCSLYLSLPLYLLTIVTVGSRQRALATLLHESSHGSIAKNRTINYLLGTVFGGWNIFQSWAVYHKSHVIEHHAHIGDADRDPDYKAIIDYGLYGQNRSAMKLKQYILRIFFSPNQTLSYIKYLFYNRIYNPLEPKKERLIRLGYITTMLSIIIYTNNFVIFCAYWLVPMFTTANWVGSLIELAEHYPLIELASEKNELYYSRNRLHINVIEYFFLGMHEESWHLVHHLFPRMPFYRQAEAHQWLMTDPEYAKLQRTRGWIGIFTEMFELADSQQSKVSEDNTNISLTAVLPQSPQAVSIGA